MTSSPLDWSLKGQVILTDTSAAPTANYYAMHVIAAAVVSEITYVPGYDVTGDWSDLTTIPAGAVLAGRFLTLTLASGEVILHKE